MISLYTQITLLFSITTPKEANDNCWESTTEPRANYRFQQIPSKSAFGIWWSLKELSQYDVLLNQTNIFVSDFGTQGSGDGRTFSKPPQCLLSRVDCSLLVIHIWFSLCRDPRHPAVLLRSNCCSVSSVHLNCLWGSFYSNLFDLSSTVPLASFPPGF